MDGRGRYWALGLYADEACLFVYYLFISLIRWGKRAAHNRAQIMYYLAENLEVRRAEFVDRIQKLTGCDAQAAETEVDLTLQRLFHWASYSDKYGGTVQVLCSHLSLGRGGGFTFVQLGNSRSCKIMSSAQLMRQFTGLNHLTQVSDITI